MNIGFACDHAGYTLKKHLKHYMSREKSLQNLNILDYGCDSSEISVDYPDFARALCKDIINNKIEKGILICGSGIGMSMIANRFSEIRAALCTEAFAAQLSREHNDSNVLCLGNWFVTNKMGEIILETWLNTSFAGGRHINRIDKLRISN